MKRSLLTTLFLLSTLIAFAQAPVWIEYTTRNVRFPDTKYLVGFSSEKIVRKDQPREDILERLSGYAKDKLVQSVLADIKSVTTMDISTTNGVTNEELKSASVASSNATISGLKVETYYDAGKKDETAYAFAYALKSDVITYYENEIKSYLDKFNTNFNIAVDHQKSGNNQQALKMLFGFQKDFREIEHGQMLLVTLTSNYNLPSLKRTEINGFKTKVEQKISEIRGVDQFSLEDAAYYITYALSTQLDDKSRPISVSNFTFEDTPMGSKFSRRFKAAIEQKLAQEGFATTDIIEGKSNVLILKGSYWENADKLKIITILRTQADSRALGSSECYMPIVNLTQNGIEYKPENYKEALVTMKEFSANEIVGGNLDIDIYTNKGRENLIYTENDILKLFVRANKECYIRVIYYQADGSKVLLTDNYYINRDNVNKTYELPYTFECAEPFGVETLQLSAQVDPFEALNTEEQYGYDFITEGMAAIQVKSRGFKKVKSTVEEEIKAEKRLVITTMRK